GGVEGAADGVDGGLAAARRGPGPPDGMAAGVAGVAGLAGLLGRADVGAGLRRSAAADSDGAGEVVVGRAGRARGAGQVQGDAAGGAAEAVNGDAVRGPRHGGEGDAASLVASAVVVAGDRGQAGDPCAAVFGSGGVEGAADGVDGRRPGGGGRPGPPDG